MGLEFGEGGKIDGLGIGKIRDFFRKIVACDCFKTKQMGEISDDFSRELNGLGCFSVFNLLCCDLNVGKVFRD